jgi:hypothetical protein
MTAACWRDLVLEAARRHSQGDPELIDLLVKVLEEQEDAKQALRRKGYGVTGTGLLRTVMEVKARPEW